MRILVTVSVLSGEFSDFRDEAAFISVFNADRDMIRIPDANSHKFVTADSDMKGDSIRTDQVSSVRSTRHLSY